MDRPIDRVLDSLALRAPLARRSAVLRRQSPVPRQAGVYAWFFRSGPPGVPVQRAKCREGFRLLYIGIAPSRPSSKSNLRTRLRGHFRGNASGSTLRLTLGCLLAEELDLRLRATGKTRRLTFGDGEATLSEWLEAFARVTWVELDEPWAVESDLIQSLDLPLNLEFNQSHPFYDRLRGIRSEARRRARGELQG